MDQVNIKYSQFYGVVLYVIPLLIYLSGNIYTSLSSKTWYSTIDFKIPDFFNTSYGIYLYACVLLLFGVFLVIITNYYGDNAYLVDNVNANNIQGNNNKKIIMWLTCITSFLIGIVSPILYQTQNLIAPAVIYLIISILLFVILFYSFKLTWKVYIFMIPLLVAALYMCIFYFSGEDNNIPTAVTVQQQQQPMQPMQPVQPEIINGECQRI